MRVCSRCQREKSESEFYVKDKSTGRLHTQCKSCYKTWRAGYYAKHYAENQNRYRERAKIYKKKLRDEYRENMIRYLEDKSCILCGESDMRTFEFDHINPDEKNFSISQAVRLGYSWSDVMTEIKKCRILCANCHKKHTASQAGWYKA